MTGRNRFAGILFLGCLSACAQGLSVLQEIRFWNSDQITRLALETDAEVSYDYDQLHSPERIYVDLLDTRPSRGRKAFQVPVGDGVIRQVRVALTTPTITRVVVDLDTDVEFAVSQLASPDRVVIELRAKGPVRRPAPAEVSEAPPPPPKPKPRAFQPPPVKPAAVPDPGPVMSNTEIPQVIASAPRTTPAPRSSQPLIITPPAPPPAPAPVPAAPPVGPVDTRLANPARDDRFGQKSLTRILGLKLNRVVLDAGHGGQDHGTTSPGGLVEKELVLDVTLRLGKLIEQRLGANVVYTRTDDRFVPLEARSELANRHQSDLFLSIHANSSPYRPAFGTETYYLSLTADATDRDVAARENASSTKSVHELSDLLRKIARNDKLAESRDFAARVQGSTHELVTRTHGRAYNRGVKKAPFVVLIGTQMPAVLIEIGFLTNPKEEELMAKPEYRQKLAEALCRGVVQYADSLSNFRVASREGASAGGQE
ncbi:MAG: AMIN domain-containing protein [Acidobacteria bacterium]|nr:AMIN domain-containing protein [Acidobacteriota bacterium]